MKMRMNLLVTTRRSMMMIWNNMSKFMVLFPGFLEVEIILILFTNPIISLMARLETILQLVQQIKTRSTLKVGRLEGKDGFK